MTVDASHRGRRNRANGADCERKVARYLQTWWPDACRAVRNTDPDPGDVDCTSPSLWWSVKNCAVERYPAWFAEMQAKAGDRIGLLVVRRRGYASPERWWCWIRMDDLAALVDGGLGEVPGTSDAYVCVELGALVPLLVAYSLEVSV